ncbi:MAG TPA: GNAT family N-acetyltransferase [Edaphobacter sp.]|nr:GNAT family N-acetyltransferase [Edaphobacter sp.]
MSAGSILFPNPPLQALLENHAHLAKRSGKAMKYPREVTPFAAIEENSPHAFESLFELMEPGEVTYIISDTHPAVFPGLQYDPPLGVLQMAYPRELALPEAPGSESVTLEPIPCIEAEDMVALTDIAFPGFFRRRTCEMGSYYGIRDAGRLVAMCGERMAIGDYRELSGLCTHPEYRGRGYAPILMVRLMQNHRAAGLRSYLHVAANNTNAIALYEKMGFEHRGEFQLYRVTRQV